MSEGSAMSPLSINEGHERRTGYEDIGQFHATLQPNTTPPAVGFGRCLPYLL